MKLKEIKRRLARLIEMRDKLCAEHYGQEQKFTYWAGYRLGELKGKISILEDIVDFFEGDENEVPVENENNEIIKEIISEMDDTVDPKLKEYSPQQEDITDESKKKEM